MGDTRAYRIKNVPFQKLFLLSWDIVVVGVRGSKHLKNKIIFRDTYYEAVNYFKTKRISENVFLFSVIT